MRLIGLFFLTMVCVFTLDMIWLGFIAKAIYAENLGILLRKSGESMAPIWWSAAVVYMCIALGIVYFVLPAAQGNYLQSIVGGIILGFVTYGIYDFTNYSILASWPWKITIIDFIWGMMLCGLSSLFAALIQNRFFS